MSREEREIEIDFLQLLEILWNNCKYIILATIILGVVGFLGSKLFLTPIYEASAKMIVNTRKDETQNITNDQINSAKSLVNTYAIIIGSRDVLNQVIFELDLPESYSQLASKINVKAVNNTQVMQIAVRHKNRDTALAIAMKILEIAPGAIVEKVEAGSVKQVEQAYASQAPVSPNAGRNAVLMALVGFALSVGVIVVVFLTDNTYKSDMDIQRDFEVPVLGVIPTVESCKSQKKYGYSAKGRK